MKGKTTSRSEYGGRSYEIRVLGWDGAAFTVDVLVDGLPLRQDSDHSWPTYGETVRRGHELAKVNDRLLIEGVELPSGGAAHEWPKDSYSCKAIYPV